MSHKEKGNDEKRVKEIEGMNKMGNNRQFHKNNICI